MIESFLKYLLAEKQYSKLTISSYRGDISQFCLFIGQSIEEINLEEITHKEVRSFIMNLNEQGVNIKSINRKISSLKTLYKYLYIRGYVTSNPTLKITSLKGEKRLPHFVNKKSMDSLLTQCLDDSSELSLERDRCIITLFYTTGMRLSELVELNNESFNTSNREIIVKGKGNKQRLIPLCKIAHNKLSNYLNIRDEALCSTLPEDPLLLNDNNKRVSRSYVYRMINSTLKTLGVDGKCSPHVLRHSFATHLLGAGVGIESVKELLGHASLATTQIYAHNSIEQLIEIRDKHFPES
ncbi:MAG: tyrosine-type recombinase/integrase [Rikenellaceae bacterium]